MELYFKFVFVLAFGLFGLGMVMKILMENLLHEWDLFTAIRAFSLKIYRGHGLVQTARAEDILLEAERNKLTPLSTRLIEARREELKQIDLVEHQLSQPAPADAPSQPAWANPKYDDAWR